MTNPYDPSPLYSYPGWPAFVPSTSLMTLPMGGLGEMPARNSSALGNAVLVPDSDITVRGRVYTYRTWSKVPINPDREVNLQLSGLGGLGIFPLIPLIGAGAAAAAAYSGLAGETAWEAAASKGWRIAAPRGHASFWQNRTQERMPDGQMGYKTSLNVTPTGDGVTAGALKWAARRVLSFMSGSGSEADVSNISPGWLYRRDATEESAGLLRRAGEAVLGRERTQRAVELGEEIASTAEAAALGSQREREAEERRSQQTTMLMVGAGILALGIGIFLSTRKGSSKLERRAYGVATGARREAREAAGAALGVPTVYQGNRRRQRRKRNSRRRRSNSARRRNSQWKLIGTRTVGGKRFPAYRLIDRERMNTLKLKAERMLVAGKCSGWA